MSITAFSFGEWLPDLPDLGNPGLIEAANVLPFDGYAAYKPLSTTLNALASNPRYGLRATGGGGDYIYVGISSVSAGRLLRGIATGGVWTDLSAATYTPTGTWQMAQFREYVVATNGFDSPQFQTLGSASSFATLGSTTGNAPAARNVAVVGQFLVLGNLLGDSYSVQWSGVGAPTSWPTPNSSTAIAQQSGKQTLDSELGTVSGIFGGDQFGLIMQTGGIVRMTYAGPPVVFQFDTISRGIGLNFQNGAVKIGEIIYFASFKGFFATDGTTTVPIGKGKVDSYFISLVDTTLPALVSAGVDWQRKLIYWSFPTAADSGNPSQVLIYSYVEKRWTHASDTVRLMVKGTESTFETFGFEAFGNDQKLGRFTGTPGTATFTSGEVEPQPGGCALINGIKAIVASSGTAPTIGVQVGSRDDQATTVSYSSTTAPTSRTGFADFRSDARFHRARVYIAGNFDKALGLEIDATPTGGV